MALLSVASTSVGGTQFRLVRAIKPLRYFKIARIMKLGKASPIIAFLMDSWEVTPKQVQSAKVAYYH